MKCCSDCNIQQKGKKLAVKMLQARIKCKPIKIISLAHFVIMMLRSRKTLAAGIFFNYCEKTIGDNNQFFF